jgi:hypothetical protein
MRRLLLIAVVFAGLAVPGTALAGGGNYVFEGGTAAQQGQVRSALQASSFDWNIVASRVTIHIGRGLETSSTPGHVWLDADLLGSGRFAWASVQDEYAHQVDYFLFDAQTRAQLTRELGARDWCYGVSGLSHAEYGCERFASTLVWAFWPSKHNAYRPSSPRDESAAMPPPRFRALVTGLLGIRNPFALRR